MIIEVKAKIVSIKNGQVTELTIEEEPDLLFIGKTVKEQPLPEPDLYKPVVEVSKEKVVKKEEPLNGNLTDITFYPDKGKVIARVGNSVVHKYIAKTVKEALSKGIDIKGIIHIIGLYRPELKRNSLNSYGSVYIRYFKGTKSTLRGRYREKEILEKYGKLLKVIKGVGIREKIVNKILSEKEKGKSTEEVLKEVLPHLKRNSTLKYKHSYEEYFKEIEQGETPILTSDKKPEDIKLEEKDEDKVYAYDSIYKRNIKFGEYIKVRRAITKWDFIATTHNIANETGLPLDKVRSVVSYMYKTEKLLEKSYIEIGDGKYGYVYFPKK